MSYLTFLSVNKRWLVGGLLLTMFSGFGQTFFISLSSADLREEFDLSHGDFGLIYMLATLGSALVLPWVGRSVDSFPIQRVAAAVMIVLATFCIAMANVSSIWMLVFVIFGLRLSGQGMMTHTSQTAMGRWFSAQRGRAVSVANLGLPAAESIFPVLFVMIAGLVGWRLSWAIAAGVLLIFVLPTISWLLRQNRQPQNPDLGGRNAEGRQWTRGEVLRDPVFWAISCGTLAPPFILTAILFNQVYLVTLRGWTLELFAGAFVVMAMTSVISSLTCGALVDRFSARQLLPFLLLPLALACLVLAQIHAFPAVFAFMALLGISNGLNSTMSGALWAEIYGVRHIGAIRSIAVAMMVFASAAGPGLIGVLIDYRVPYDSQLVGMSVYCLLATAVLAYATWAVKNRVLFVT
ncbi:MFS transporter [Roseibium sp. H3510]|uniref:MFS transporter n=1 Tax=Roseibium algae TaxID=3123038 RepID=A0ABU8TPH9_9HYPH